MQSCASVDAFVSRHRHISDFINSLLAAYHAILFMLICFLSPRGWLGRLLRSGFPEIRDCPNLNIAYCLRG